MSCTSAWLHIGEVTAGMDTDQVAYASRSGWLRVPPLSESAAAVYQRDTAIHQDVYAEIEALERAITRNRRLAEGLERRMDGASETVQVALKMELDQIEFRTLHAESLLDARRLEYEDLPQSEHHYMPVTIRISIIESRSEKRALKVLSAYLEENSSRYADAATDALGVERSLDDSAPAGQESSARLQEARADYFDARIALEDASSTEDANLGDAERNLTQALDVYNAARSELGIPAI